LSGRGLCDELITRPEESYRLCRVVVCDLETSRIGAPYIYNISSLRVKTHFVQTFIVNSGTKKQLTLTPHLFSAGPCDRASGLENAIETICRNFNVCVCVCVCVCNITMANICYRTSLQMQDFTWNVKCCIISFLQLHHINLDVEHWQWIVE